MHPASYALGHIALRVSNLARARAFYVETLHFPAILEIPGRLLLNVHGIVIALLGDDPHTGQEDRFSPYRVGLDHLALAVPDPQELNTLLEYLQQAGVPNHGLEEDELTHARYISFYDPDGIAWELYATTRR
ncbi:VOC family protein [Dictyobacter aurantiacus]|nr:VOC family protein [Dictyobacter aurantiacus]